MTTVDDGSVTRREVVGPPWTESRTGVCFRPAQYASRVTPPATTQVTPPSHPASPTGASRLVPSTWQGAADDETNSSAALAYPSQACQPAKSPACAPATEKPSSAIARNT